MTRFSVIIEEFTVNENDLLTHQKFLIVLTSVETLWKHAKPDWAEARRTGFNVYIFYWIKRTIARSEPKSYAICKSSNMSRDILPPRLAVGAGPEARAPSTGPDVCWPSLSQLKSLDSLFGRKSEDKREPKARRLAGPCGVKMQTDWRDWRSQRLRRCKRLAVIRFMLTNLPFSCWFAFLALAVWTEHIWPSVSSKQPPGL